MRRHALSCVDLNGLSFCLCITSLYPVDTAGIEFGNPVLLYTVMMPHHFVLSRLLTTKLRFLEQTRRRDGPDGRYDMLLVSHCNNNDDDDDTTMIMTIIIIIN